MLEVFKVCIWVDASESWDGSYKFYVTKSRRFLTDSHDTYYSLFVDEIFDCATELKINDDSSLSHLIYIV